jgi:hypothetical protein
MLQNIPAPTPLFRVDVIVNNPHELSMLLEQAVNRLIPTAMLRLGPDSCFRSRAHRLTHQPGSNAAPQPDGSNRGFSTDPLSVFPMSTCQVPHCGS